MKILKEATADMSDHVGDKCKLTFEQGPNYTPIIMSDNMDAIFKGYKAGTTANFQTKSGEFSIRLEGCKSKEKNGEFTFSGKSGDIVIKF